MDQFASERATAYDENGIRNTISIDSAGYALSSETAAKVGVEPYVNDDERTHFMAEANDTKEL